jgi:type I restriction enzyme S subunit
VTDGTHDSPKLQKEGVPFIKGKHISGGIIDLENCDFITLKDHEKACQRVKPQRGDILFSNIGSVGDTAVVKSDCEFSIKNVALFRADKRKVDQTYLYYLVLSPEFRANVLKIRSGSAQPFISLANLRSFEVSYHDDKDVQRKIAAILSAYDDLIENNLRRIKILEEMAQTIYREWFVKFRFPACAEASAGRPGHQKVKMVDSPLGKIPEGWEATDILALIEEKKDRNADDKIFPVLSVTNNRAFVLSDDFFSKRVYSRSLKNYKLVEKNDFAFNPARVNIGSIAMLDNQQAGLVSPMYSVFRVNSNRVLPLLLWTIINEERTMDQIRKLCFGTVRQIFKLNDFRKVMIVLPTMDVQMFWLSINDLLGQQIRLLRMKNDILRKTRDLLLPKLISGELNVSEMDITIPEANA